MEKYAFGQFIIVSWDKHGVKQPAHVRPALWEARSVEASLLKSGCKHTAVLRVVSTSSQEDRWDAKPSDHEIGETNGQD